MIWTDERKRKVLDHLKKVNEELQKALDAVAQRNTADAADHILDAVTEKHAAVDDFPPIDLAGGKTISMGGLFQFLEKKDMFVTMALYAGSTDQLWWLRPTVIDALSALISQVEGLLAREWINPECVDILRKLEEKLKQLKSFLEIGVAGNKEVWELAGDIRKYQAELLDTAYGDKDHGMSEVVLGLIDLDSRLAGVLDKLTEWQHQQDAKTESGPDTALYLKNILDIAKENKEEIEKKIRAFAY